MEISTQRLLLQKITPDLIHEMFREQSESAIRDFFGIDANGYLRLKEMHEKGMETHRLSLCYFLLLDKESNQVLGECGFHTWNKSHQRAELFYHLKQDSDKRKGLMSEALLKVLEYGFNQMQLHRIEALTASWNAASIGLLQRFGFSKEGTMREDYLIDGKHEDSQCYALLRWEWDRNNA